jgi:hypothetical protein
MAFLRHLWDRTGIHRSRTVREYLESLRGQIAVEYLPADAPKLNPDHLSGLGRVSGGRCALFSQWSEYGHDSSPPEAWRPMIFRLRHRLVSTVVNRLEFLTESFGKTKSILPTRTAIRLWWSAVVL